MMQVLSPTTRMRLEVQGFGHVHDDVLMETGLWLRLPVIVYALFGLVGTLTLSPWLLWAMVPLGIAGAAWAVHPVDGLYNRWLRSLTGTGPLPPRGVPSRFAHGMLASCFLVAGLGFWEEIETIGYAAGATATALTLLTSSSDICVLSTIYRGIFGYHKRSPRPHRRTSPDLRHGVSAAHRD